MNPFASVGTRTTRNARQGAIRQPIALQISIGIALAVLGLSVPHPARGQPAESNLVFVLDASGSMWGRVASGEMKITAAKTVMADLLKDVPESMKIGLVAYGHRWKGDCGDIAPLGTLGTAPSTISSAMQGITPRGKTPITDSLRHALTSSFTRLA